MYFFLLATNKKGQRVLMLIKKNKPENLTFESQFEHVFLIIFSEHDCKMNECDC